MQPNDDKWKLAAKEGREAITVLQPDLIVTDFKMPLADGIQAATEISATTPSSIVMYAIYTSDELDAQTGVVRLLSRNRTAFSICQPPLMRNYRRLCDIWDALRTSS